MSSYSINKETFNQDTYLLILKNFDYISQYKANNIQFTTSLS